MFLSRFSRTIRSEINFPRALPFLLISSSAFANGIQYANMHTQPDIQTMSGSNTKTAGQAMGTADIKAPGPPASAPGADFEVRQTSDTQDFTPDPSKSIPLPPNRQALLDDIIELYSCHPTIERVKRYTPDCVYDDQFVYANDRYKMAGQWFALPKLFNKSVCEKIQVVRSDDHVLQFKNEQSWTFKLIPKTATINALVTLSLDPETVNSDFERVKYHKDQANDKDYSHTGLGFSFKKYQADKVVEYMDSPEIREFEKDKGAGSVGGEKINTYKSGKEDGNAPKSSF